MTTLHPNAMAWRAPPPHAPTYDRWGTRGRILWVRSDGAFVVGRISDEAQHGGYGLPDTFDVVLVPGEAPVIADVTSGDYNATVLIARADAMVSPGHLRGSFNRTLRLGFWPLVDLFVLLFSSTTAIASLFFLGMLGFLFLPGRDPSPLGGFALGAVPGFVLGAALTARVLRVRGVR